MKLSIFLSAVTMLSINFETLAASKALQDRGASCTNYCTIGGKSVTQDLTLAGFQKADADITSNFNTLRKKIDLINAQCRVLAESEKKDAAHATNYNWCEANCMKKGSIYSRLNGRQEKVKSFIEKRKIFCKQTLKNYGDLFHQIIKYDNIKDMLIAK